jgi:hypothetical protein
VANNKIVHHHIKRDKPMPNIIKIILAMGRRAADKRYGPGSYDWAKDGISEKNNQPIIMDHSKIP